MSRADDLAALFAEMAALLARIDDASGPSRELDAEVEAVFFGGKPSHWCERAERRSFPAGTVFELHGDGEDYNDGVILERDVIVTRSWTSLPEAASWLVGTIFRCPKVVFSDVSPGYCCLGVSHAERNIHAVLRFETTRPPRDDQTALAVLSALLKAQMHRVAKWRMQEMQSSRGGPPAAEGRTSGSG